MTTTWQQMEAERAFSALARRRRRAWLLYRLRRCSGCLGLAVVEPAPQRRRAREGVREIPVEAIRATTEPNRAAQFDREFRPSPRTRCRWLRVWRAAAEGRALPPISVVEAGEGYAIRDGHHRVSVARARGAVTITACVAAA